MPLRLVLFDLDGVLVNSRANMEAAWAHVCATFGFDIPFERYFAEIMDRIGAPGDRKALAAAYSEGSVAHFALIQPYEGVGALLSSLDAAGLKLGIVTSKDADRTRRAVDLIGFDFATVCAPRPGLAGKPAPDQLLAAAADAGVDPSDSVYVGDMAVDFEAARNAGMAYAHAGWGYGDAPGGCDVVAETPAALSVHLIRR